MNDAWGEANEMPEVSESTPKGLRDWAENVKKQNETLLARLDAMENERKQEKVNALFESEGLSSAATHYKGNPDVDEAKAWIESMRSVFGNGQAGPEVVPPAPAIAPDAANQFQQMAEAGATSAPLSTMDAAISAQKSATSIEELAANYARFANGG